MKRTSGFTLIELLVVILLIGVLASFILAVGGSMIDKARRADTVGTILAIDNASKQYSEIFQAFPDIDMPNGYNATYGVAETPLADYDDADYLEYNKRLRFMLEGEMISLYTIDEIRIDPPLVGSTLPKQEDPGDTTDNRFVYEDAWGNYLRISPGRDHSADAIGPKTNNLPKKKAIPPPTYVRPRSSKPLDIFSISSNETDDTSPVVPDSETTAVTEDSDDIHSWNPQINEER